MHPRSEQGGERRRAPGHQSDGSSRTKLSRAIAGWYRYTIEATGVPAFLAEAWAAASRKPLIRDMVAQRRERIATVTTVMLQEGVAAASSQGT